MSWVFILKILSIGEQKIRKIMKFVIEKGFNFFIENYKKSEKGLKFNLKEEKLFKVSDVRILSVKYWRF